MNQRALFFSILLAVLALVPASARANDDAVQFGYDINVSANHPVHDAVCFFCSVHVEGEVKGDVVVFFGGVRIDGKTQGDIVNFFGPTRLADNSIVGRDLVNFLGTVRAGENVQIGRSLVIMFGGLRAPASLSIGKDRFVQPGWLLWIPFIIFAMIVIVIVREFRAWQRRRMLTGYSFPPQL
jgi:hypothetical protein